MTLDARGRASPRPSTETVELRGGSAWRGAAASAVLIVLRIATGPGREVARKAQDPGDDLFSRKAALSVSSALESLTSVFGMGTGMASPLVSPGFHASGWLFGCAGRDPAGAPIVDLRISES